MPDKIDKVKEIVRKHCFGDDYNYHVLPTVRYAKMLAAKLNADKEVIELAALLHDIAVKDNDERHEIVGAERAVKIMKDMNYSDNVIERVRECILTHRTRGEPKNKEAEIIRNADAMAHVDSLPFLIKVGLERKGSLAGAIDWVNNKLGKVDKKLTLPEARIIIKNKYDAARILLGGSNDNSREC
jgi:uncharacterized protein